MKNHLLIDGAPVIRSLAAKMSLGNVIVAPEVDLKADREGRMKPYFQGRLLDGLNSPGHIGSLLRNSGRTTLAGIDQEVDAQWLTKIKIP